MKQRALSDDDKALRRNAILAAARELFVRDSHQLPSAAQIAQASGLAKGTVYLYFRTKEEIFVALLAQEFDGLLRRISSYLESAALAQGLDGLLQEVCEYIATHPEFLRLDAMAYSVLEQNLSEAYLLEFKTSLTQTLVSTGQRVDLALQLPAGRGAALLLRTHALIRGLWQTLDYPEYLQRILAAPQFAPIRPHFQTELLASLRDFWAGALASGADSEAHTTPHKRGS